jgi:hypothetical protein
VQDLLEKFHAAANAHQKEKHEIELKKEIKKLQRLRDQIKQWIASADIKDKKELMENRKLIETVRTLCHARCAAHCVAIAQQMELFREIERESKTKAFSKEGLEKAARKIDPEKLRQSEEQEWISDMIEKLQRLVCALAHPREDVCTHSRVSRQIDQLETELESTNTQAAQLSSKKKKGQGENSYVTTSPCFPANMRAHADSSLSPTISSSPSCDLPVFPTRMFDCLGVPNFSKTALSGTTGTSRNSSKSCAPL